MNTELLINNARLVLRNEIVEGSLRAYDGRITDIDSHPTGSPGAIDFAGDYLLPGLIEMHTDNLEKHMMPRPGVYWPLPIGAALAHDTQIAGAGITTVFDAISVGSYRDKSERKAMLSSAIDAVARARHAGLLRADHLVHLRCEVSDPHLPELLEGLIESPLVRLLSVMDHTPGQRQWRNLAKMKQYHNDDDMPDDKLDAFVNERLELQAQFSDKHRELVVMLGHDRSLPMASHDDTTIDHVKEAFGDGIMISEFPTTHEAAITARTHGMAIVMGAPNLVRGGSHSGNVSAVDLADENLLDALSSDYVPSSLLQSAFHMHHQIALSLPAAVAKVSVNVADMVGLMDRGEIAIDKQADLVWVSDIEGLPVVRQVWRAGERVI